MLPQDENAKAALELRSLYERVQRDIFSIAKRPYESPNEMTCMHAFCLAAIKLRDMEKPLPKAYLGYAAILDQPDEEFFQAYSLIFSSASELRLIANTTAHRLTLPLKDVEQLLSATCPEAEHEITRMCFAAFRDFLTPAEREEEERKLHEAFVNRHLKAVDDANARHERLKLARRHTNLDN